MLAILAAIVFNNWALALIGFLLLSLYLAGVGSGPRGAGGGRWYRGRRPGRG
jgi:hypothetical protein